MIDKVKVDWEKEYERNYPVEKFQEVAHYWWQDCYKQIEDFVLGHVFLDKNSEILESGCGSGNSSLKLASLVKKVILLDTSNAALNCAKKLANYYKVKNVEFVKSDTFNIPFKNERFDFCWNIGLIEHYNSEEAKKIIKEMLRVIKQGGWICIGVPNFASLPIIKARLLSFKPLKPLTFWIKGYRLEEERKYRLKDLNNLLFLASKESGVGLTQVSSDYVGSILPVETPNFIFKKINKFFSTFFSKFSFLILISAKVKK